MKRTRRFLIRLVAALTAGIVVVAAGAAWLVATGPVSLSFLTPYFEDALVLSDSGYRVLLVDTQLAWGGWDRTLDLRAIDVRVVAPDGAIVAQAPEISVTLSAKALLNGQLAPTRIDLIEPELRLVRGEDGRVGLGVMFGEPSRAGSMLQVLLAALNQPPQSGTPLAYLSRVGIARATVWIEDHAAGAEWFAPRLDATLLRKTAGISANVDLILALQDGAVAFTATADYADVPGMLTIAAGFTDLNPATLLASATKLDAPVNFDAQFDGNFAALIDRDGGIQRIEFDVAAGTGTLDAPMIWPSLVGFDSASVRGTILDSLRTLRIDDLFITQSGATAEASGVLTFALRGLGFVVDATWFNVPADRVNGMWPPELAPRARAWVVESVHGGMVSQGSLHMRVGPGDIHHVQERGDIDLRFAYAGGRATYLSGQPDLVDARGNGRLTGRTFDLTVDAGRVGTLAITEGAVHINGMETEVPSMVVEMVASGRTAEAMRVLSLPPLELELPQGFGGAVAARAQFALPLNDHLSADQVKYAAAANLRDLSIPGAMPNLVLSGGAMSLRADANGVDAQGTIAANGSPLVVDFRYPLRGAALAAHASVPVRVTATGVLSDDARRKLGVDTGSLIQGPVGMRANLEFAEAMQFRRGTFDIDLQSARVELPGEGWDKPVGERGTATFMVEPGADGTLHLPAATLQTPQLIVNGDLTIDNTAGTAAGTASVNGYDMMFSWVRNDPGGAGHLSAVARADEAMLAAFGYPVAPWVKGPMQFGVDVDLAGVEPGATRVALDLRDATIAVPAYDKPAGRDGFAELGFAPDATGSFQLRSFALTAVGLVAAGSLDIAADGTLRRMQVARLILGETNLAATLDRQANGTLLVNAQGGRLDLRPLLAAEDNGAPAIGLPPVQITGRFDRLVVADERVLQDAAGTAVFREGAWRSLGATAHLANGATVAVAIADGEDGQDMSLTSTDAGALFAALGLFQGATGGTLDVKGKIKQTRGRSLEGVAKAQNFRIVRAPALAQVLALASLGGMVDVLQGAGLNFNEFEANFRISAGGLTLADAVARGPIGITIEGNVDRSNDRVALNGLIVPAYNINAVLGAIPGIGDLLIGEGLGAVNYRVTGSPSDPVIIINPASALAVGILRRLFFPNQPR